MKQFRLLLAFAVFAGSAASSWAAFGNAEVASAATLIALGRHATMADNALAGDLAAQVTAWKQRLAADGKLATEVAQQAFFDAFGHSPMGSELSATGPLTYAEWMQRHVQTLTEQPAQYEASIRAAYPLVIHRAAYPEEIAYWKKYGAVSYCLLVASIEDWARRNQPGLMVTAGIPCVSVNSRYLATVQIPPGVAAEVREILHLNMPPQPTLGRVLAVGGNALESDGGIYFVAAGHDDRQ